MQGIRDFYARHPIAAWTLTIGGLLVIAWGLFSRAVSPAVSQDQVVTSTGPSDAQIAASTALQQSSIAAAADTHQADNQLQLGLAQLSLESVEAQAQSANDSKQLDYQYGLGLVQTQASTDQFSMAAALQQHEDDNATAAAINSVNANAGVNQSLIASNVAISQNASAATVAVAQANAKTAQKSSSNGLLGGIVGAIGSIFSDERLKKNIIPVGMDKSGVMWFDYEYTMDAFNLEPRLPRGRVRGVLAKQLLSTPYAHAVSRRQGFLAVDYSALAQGRA